MTQLEYPIIVGTEEELASSLAGRVAGLLTRVRSLEAWSIALSGGSVATRLLPHLGQQPLPWQTAHVFFVDERAVPPESDDSNWRLCRDCAAGTPMRDAQWHRLEADAPDPVAAADAYVDLLASITGPALELDVVLLGVGEDGHVASIFPGSALDAETRRTVAVVTGAPKPPQTRMSMSLPLLAGARLTAVAAFGSSKRGVMDAARDPASTRPVARLLRAAHDALVLLDRDASG